MFKLDHIPNGTGYLFDHRINSLDGNRINIWSYPSRLFIRPPTWTYRLRRCSLPER